MLSNEQLQEFQQTIIDWYGMARESILFYQTEERKRAVEAITELRDVLDHFWVACTATTHEEIEAALADITEHLRSVAVEPLERAVEERFAKAQDSRENVGGFRGALRRFLLVGPPSSLEVAELETMIRQHIREGRQLKSRQATARHAVQEFKEAHRQIVQLEALYRDQDVSDRSYTLIVAVVVGIVVGLLMLAVGWIVG